MPTFYSEELAEWSGGIWEPARPDSVLGASNDTRTLERGNLYFALKGKNFDGHNFVEEAFNKGASGAVVDRSQESRRCQGYGGQAGFRSQNSEWPLLVVDDTAGALRDIAAGYREKVNPEIIAITGSAGKSTVREMTAEMLSTVGKTARTKNNWNNDIGVPLSLLAMEENTSFGVFEAGTNHPGEITPLCDILKPSLGVVTNVGPAHIGFFGSIDAIANEKACLLRSLPANGVSVLCVDDNFFDLFQSVSPSCVITVSAVGDADYVCSLRNPVDNEAVIREKSTGDEFTFHLPVPGEHNIINAMFAAAVARRYGVEWRNISTALNNYPPLPMRWGEEKIGGVLLINDAYNANPLSMRASINAFKEMHIDGRKWLVLGDMLELGSYEKEEHVAIGEFVASNQWAGLIVQGSLGKLIAQSAENAGFNSDSIFYCENHDEIAEILTENATDEDAVLLKASRGIGLEKVVEILKERRKG
ncbi:UDP-N-acetylmuramoyl-tripeptide--D-alanyl-D-alanine ligase [Verrucomicrobiota bacterium]